MDLVNPARVNPITCLLHKLNNQVKEIDYYQAIVLYYFTANFWWCIMDVCRSMQVQSSQLVLRGLIICDKILDIT